MVTAIRMSAYVADLIEQNRELSNELSASKATIRELKDKLKEANRKIRALKSKANPRLNDTFAVIGSGGLDIR